MSGRGGGRGFPPLTYSLQHACLSVPLLSMVRGACVVRMGALNSLEGVGHKTVSCDRRVTWGVYRHAHGTVDGHMTSFG